MWIAQAITAPADGIQPAVLLEAAGAQYLFNVPEAFSRLALEHKCRPKGSLRAVFALGAGTAATGGLGGLLLRLKADGHGQLRLIGPTGMIAVAHALRHSIRWEHPQVLLSQCLPGPLDSSAYQDEQMEVTALDSNADGSAEQGAALKGAHQANGGTAVRHIKHVLVTGSPNPLYSRSFDPGEQGPVRSQAAGPGRDQHLWGYLCHMRACASVLLFLCCRDLTDMAQISRHPVIASLQHAHASRRVVVFHMTSWALSHQSDYATWLTSLPGQQVQVAGQQQQQELGFVRAACAQVSLAALAPARFLPPAALPWMASLAQEESKTPPEESVPLPHTQQSPMGHTSPLAPLQDVPVPACLLGEAGAVRVTFLGTGAAEPSKHRAPSAIHLQVTSAAGVLLDCGEGTWGQFVHFWGASGAVKKVEQLACVWISHKHADHMLGLGGILSARSHCATPLLVIGTRAVQSWLRELGPHMGWRYIFVSCSMCTGAALNSMLTQLGLAGWQCIPVRHCRDAWGCVLTSRQGWRIAYSGDTLPCIPTFSQAALGATLLIHEATFESDMAHQAQAKRHSTVDGALQTESSGTTPQYPLREGQRPKRV
ncbi:hypothetical protein WJX73_002299 [Symbiochloris irregularis]|uniref:ribonuclease Z n=1 Tax=Symbiochloris irregularis TaxID=706552 RepID=A0AAW1PYQ5_9CHLO